VGGGGGGGGVGPSRRIGSTKYWVGRNPTKEGYKKKRFITAGGKALLKKTEGLVDVESTIIQTWRKVVQTTRASKRKKKTIISVGDLLGKWKD